jgi:hypothetical protein
MTNATSGNNTPVNYTPKFGADNRGCLITVMTPSEPLPAAFKLQAANAAVSAIIRVTGGCKGFTKEASDGMVPFFVDAFAERDSEGHVLREFQGVVFSGGTANADARGNLLADMVTNVPAVLAHYYDCIALSTTPRTDDLYASRTHAGLAVGDQAIDVRQHAAAIVQKSAAEAASDWDLDLPVYFAFMEDLVEQDFKAAIIAMNGGDITRNEIYEALSRGFHVIVIEGSLRESDAFVAAFRDGNWDLTAAEWKAKQLGKGLDAADVEKKWTAIVDGCKAVLAKVPASQVSIVKLNDAAALRAVLIEKGLLV